MRIQNEQQIIPSPANCYLPVLAGKEEVSCEPRRSPKLTPRNKSPVFASQSHGGPRVHIRWARTKRLFFQRSQFDRPKYVSKNGQPKKPEDPDPSCPPSQETRANQRIQADPRCAARSLRQPRSPTFSSLGSSPAGRNSPALLYVTGMSMGPLRTNPTSSRAYPQAAVTPPRSPRLQEPRPVLFLSVFSNIKYDCFQIVY